MLLRSRSSGSRCPRTPMAGISSTCCAIRSFAELKLRVTPTSLPDVLLIEPRVFGDERGFFYESWNKRAFAQAGLDIDFVQDNHSRSRRGVLRGLHYQIEHAQGKLVRAAVGEVFDVAVDLRRSSPNFGRAVGITLSAQ